ncbi:MAG: Gfo/Idh/MocA family oxidoreductase [Flavobacteriales bacterium]
MAINNIVIIGCGNIGARHLQAFATTTENMDIWVIDPKPESIENAKKLWADAIASHTGCKANVQFNLSTELLPENIFLAIIATNSDARYKALSGLLLKSKPTHVILEKFLFQTSQEFEDTSTLLKQHAITSAYVNCPRRLFEAYSGLYTILKRGQSITMSVTGNSWGMASNSIHFIDLFQMLIGDEKITHCRFNQSPDTLITASKRGGFIEVNGQCEARGSSGSVLTLNCGTNDFDGIEITIGQGETVLHVLEKAGKIKISSNGKTSEFIMPYQSQLTHTYYSALKNAEKFRLVSYKESTQHHLLFISAIEKLVADKNYSLPWKIT